MQWHESVCCRVNIFREGQGSGSRVDTSSQRLRFLKVAVIWSEVRSLMRDSSHRRRFQVSTLALPPPQRGGEHHGRGEQYLVAIVVHGGEVAGSW